jgi:hypothetical protein
MGAVSKQHWRRQTTCLPKLEGDFDLPLPLFRCLFQMLRKCFKGFRQVSQFEADVTDPAAGLWFDLNQPTAFAQAPRHFRDYTHAKASPDQLEDRQKLVGLEISRETCLRPSAYFQSLVLRQCPSFRISSHSSDTRRKLTVSTWASGCFPEPPDKEDLGTVPS